MRPAYTRQCSSVQSDNAQAARELAWRSRRAFAQVGGKVQKHSSPLPAKLAWNFPSRGSKYSYGLASRGVHAPAATCSMRQAPSSSLTPPPLLAFWPASLLTRPRGPRRTSATSNESRRFLPTTCARVFSLGQEKQKSASCFSPVAGLFPAPRGVVELSLG